MKTFWTLWVMSFLFLNYLHAGNIQIGWSDTFKLKHPNPPKSQITANVYGWNQLTQKRKGKINE